MMFDKRLHVTFTKPERPLDTDYRQIPGHVIIVNTINGETQNISNLTSAKQTVTTA
jgi:hypothetical protein